jgi:hypothetical protein
MGSFLSKNENSTNQWSNILWLKKQLWAWILLGIFIMSVFFYIAKGLIVFIGGTFLGIYLYNIYGKDKGNTTSAKVLNSTIDLMKNGVNSIMGNQSGDYSHVKENFNNFTKNTNGFSKQWYFTTR